MRAAIIVDSKVDNIIEVDSLDVLEGVRLVDAPGASIGDSWDGESFTAPSAPPASPAVPDYVTAIQAMLDTKVQERRYYNILSACTYATDTNPTFKAEGQACVEWRGAVWAKAYATLDEVTAGTIPQPTIDELLATLPTMTWPS